MRYNNNNVYLIKRPYQQEPFKGAVQIICNIIIPQIMYVFYVFIIRLSVLRFKKVILAILSQDSTLMYKKRFL